MKKLNGKDCYILEVSIDDQGLEWDNINQYNDFIILNIFQYILIYSINVYSINVYYINSKQIMLLIV